MQKLSTFLGSCARCAAGALRDSLAVLRGLVADLCKAPRLLDRSFARERLPTLELILVDQAALEAALDSLKALAPMPSKSLGLFSLTLELVLNRRRICAMFGGRLVGHAKFNSKMVAKCKMA